MFNKKPKFELGQIIYISYIVSIEKKKVTGVLKTNDGFKYILNGDSSFYYHEHKLYETKEDAKKVCLNKAEKSYKETIKNIKNL